MMKELWTEANAFRWAAGQNAWIYWDASAYYKAFIEACSGATREIYITGWDIHSETNLAPDWEGSWIPRYWSLNQFFRRLLDSKPDLHIYLLCWDFAPIYFLEREKLQSLRFGWFSHPRMHFKMDAAHPVGASHHQKFVVVDQGLSFVGGLDLTIRRWDDCDHKKRHPLRRDPQGQAYPPFHDIMIGFAGALSVDLAEIFRERWERATGDVLPDHGPLEKPLLQGDTHCSFTMQDVSMALSRTVPEFRDHPQHCEVSQLYADLIHGAQHQILMENQYLTSKHIVQLLSEVLAKEDGPEVLIILPESAGGWLEKNTMGTLQAQALYQIKQHDKYDRFEVLSPSRRDLRGTKRSVTVHSKVIVIDSRIISVGSANLNNRSMGLDTECNATVQLQEPAPELAAQLLAHHTQAKAETIIPHLKAGGTLREAVAILNKASKKRYLKSFPIEEVKHLLIDAELIDAEKPSLLEEGMDRWSRTMQMLSLRLGLSSPRVLVGLGFILLALFLLAWYGVLKDSPIDYKRILAFFQSRGEDSWMRHALVPLSFAIGGLLFVPINILILATAALFPWGQALGHIVLGIIVNVAACYGTGHAVGRFFLRRFCGPRVREVLRRLSNGHFLTLVGLRLVPIAPNSLINFTAGIGRVPFFRFLSATLLGMTPGLVLLVVFQKSLFSVLEKPEVLSILMLLGLIVFAILLAQWSLRRFSHYGRS